MYRIERRYPLGADSESVAAKEIAFDGKVPVTVFDDSFLTVVLQARGNSEQSGAANSGSAGATPE